MIEQPDAWSEVEALAASGRGYGAIGNTLGLSANHVAQIVRTCRKRREHGRLIEEERRRPLLKRRIANCDLSVRARNALRNHDIVTVEDLAALSERDLLLIPNIGPVVREELRAFLVQR